MSTKEQYNKAWEDWKEQDPEGYAQAMAQGLEPDFYEPHGQAGKHVGEEKSPLDYASVDPVLPGDEEIEAPQAPAQHTALEAVIEVLWILGAARSRETRIKASVLLAIAAKVPVPFADIAEREGLTRAAVSKLARQFKSALGLTITGSTRSDAYVSQCRSRAARVHVARKQSLAKAKEIRRKQNEN